MSTQLRNLCLACLAFPTLTLAQNLPGTCGFDDLEFNPDLDLYHPTVASRSIGVDTFDVVFHLIHLNQPIGIGANISDAQVASALLSLNRDFQAWPIHDSIAIAPNGVNAEVYFRLACTAPDGSTTNGINRINAADFPGYAADGFNFKTNNQGNYQAVADLSHWPQNRYLNIWVTHKIQTFMNTLVGGGGFGPGNSVFQQGYGGVYLTYRHVGCDVDGSQGFDILNPYGRLISHETGHFLGLLHTFQGESCEETNCQTQGDRVCDTEPHTNSVSNDLNCQEYTECNTREPVENLMNYSGITCGNIFTAGQKSRMKMWIDNFLQTMVNVPACQTSAVQPLNAPIHLQLYPNPSTTDLLIISATAAELHAFRFTNARGQTVLEQIAQLGQHSIFQTNYLPPGIYLIQALDQHGRTIGTGKWIKC